VDQFEYETLTPGERREAFEAFLEAVNFSRGHRPTAGTNKRALLRGVAFGQLEEQLTEGEAARLRAAVEASVA
jgi:hypothetical protein